MSVFHMAGIFQFIFSYLSNSYTRQNTEGNHLKFRTYARNQINFKAKATTVCNKNAVTLLRCSETLILKSYNLLAYNTKLWQNKMIW